MSAARIKNLILLILALAVCFLLIAVAPGRLGIGIFGPALDERGNSVAGTALLEELSARLGLSIF